MLGDKSSPGGFTASPDGDVLAGGGEMGARMRAFDWSTSPLGPIASWPQSLRSAVSIMLNSRYPIAIYWGGELALLYNDAWSPILGTKHPWALGRGAREVWPEIWSAISPLFDQVTGEGEGTWSEDELLPMHRHGYTEECYFNFTFSPIRGEGGGVGGVFNAVVETTSRVIGERRSRFLRALAEHTAGAKDVAGAGALAAEALAAAAIDLPFALFYVLDADGQVARVTGATGVAVATPVSPAAVPLTDDDHEAATPWPLARVARTLEPELVENLPGRFGALRAGPWPEPPHAALVLPVARAGSERPYGLFVAGISPRRALDDEYRGFLTLVAGQLATAVSNARAFEEERERSEALAELDRAKTTFFSNVSHELRTPLTLMLGPTEDLLSGSAGPITPGQREQLALLHRNELRLLKLVNALLDFSRIEAGRVEASYEPVDLPAYTAELASSFRSALERAGLTFTTDAPSFPADVPAAYVDREMWEKIVLNLLSNAFKHTFVGGVAVAVRVSGDGRAAELVVRDSGVGIAADQLPRLFERFHRVPHARSRTHEGTGIGLALVQELVRMHGGEISVESQEGVGTSFTVRVPLGTAHLPPERVRAARAQGAGAPAATAFMIEASRWLPHRDLGEIDGEPGESSGLLLEEGLAVARQHDHAADGEAGGPAPRILLADDNADMRRYVVRLLRGRGWQVEVAADGRVALDQARAAAADPRGRQFDLVLSDVMMPVLDGFGLLRELRSDPATRTTPVILLSARAGEESRVEGLDAGADDYLVKPFSARELVARVGAHLGLAEVRRRAAVQSEEARMDAERARARTEQLRQLSTALAAARTSAEVAAVTVESGIRAAGASRGTVARLVEEEGTFEMLDSVGYRSQDIALYARFTILPGLPVYDAVATRSPVIVHDPTDAAAAARWPMLAEWAVLTGMRASAIFPLAVGAIGDERVLGIVAFEFNEPRAFPADEVAFYDAIVRVCAQAMDRAVAYEAEQALRNEAEEARARADEANRAKSEFLAAMSHELRTPLNAIGGHAQLLELGIHGAVSDAQRDALARIQRSQQHLLSLINDVLNFAKLEAGRVEYDLEEVVLAEVVAEVAPMIEPQLRAKGLSYDVRVYADAEVRADRDKVRQILLNLLSNAMKFTTPGGQIVVDTPVRDGSSTAADVVFLRVSDTGIGIPRDKEELIFDPFVQVHRNLTRTTEGTGLGLAISRDLARGMGGDLRVRSIEGRGSTFTLALPTAPTRQESDRGGDAERGRSTVGPEEVGPW